MDGVPATVNKYKEESFVLEELVKAEKGLSNKLTDKAIYKIRHAHNTKANWQTKHNVTSVVYDGNGYVLGVQLHVVLVVAFQIHEVDSKLEMGFFEYIDTTSDVVALTCTCEDR